MTAPTQPQLKAGRAYRTRDLARWGKNPARLARRLVREGKLREAAHGLYYAPVTSKFGPAPVPDEVLLHAFLGGEPFLISDPPRWNALGLGSTAMFAATLVYNTQRTGELRTRTISLCAALAVHRGDASEEVGQVGGDIV